MAADKGHVLGYEPGKPGGRLFYIMVGIESLKLEDQDGHEIERGFYQNHWVWAHDSNHAKDIVYHRLLNDSFLRDQKRTLRLLYEETEEQPSNYEIPLNPSGRGFYPIKWYRVWLDRLLRRSIELSWET